MADDPLAAFRSRTNASAPALSTEADGGGRDYRAFAGKDGQRKHRLDIRCKDGTAHAIGYNYLIDIAYDRKVYTGIVLVMSTMLIKIYGRGLRPVVDTLKMGVCEFIQEWDSDEFDAPDDENVPVVRRIEIVSAAQGRAEQPSQRESI